MRRSDTRSSSSVSQHLKRVDGEIDLASPLQDGEVLTKTLSLSLDPYMRGRMRAAEIESYTGAFEVSSGR